MKQYEGVVFDLDGTLLDTLADLGDSVNAALAAAGHPPRSYEEYKSIIGRGFRDLLTRSLPPTACSDAEVDAAMADFLRFYAQNYQRKTRPYPGIETVLADLRRKGVMLGVNSNKRDDYTASLIRKNFPDIPFVGVHGERDGTPKKPDPKAALALASLMGVPPDKVVYIGDSKTDILTGKNAGMATGGVLWGFRGREELEEHGADLIFQTPGEIAEIF